jgi:hypothetical protein
MPCNWNDDEVRMLIDERKTNNILYHRLPGGGKRNFWKEVAGKINQRFRTQFTGRQASEKFQGIIRDCRVNI